MRSRRIALLLAVAALLATPAHAQGTFTGTLSGQVLDPQGLPLPGVTVTATSPALQGPRSAVTSTNGDYVIPFLPPGDYKVTFELAGFKAVTKPYEVKTAQALAPLDAKLEVSGLTETVTVSAPATGEFSQQSQVASSYRQDLVEKLPLSRALRDSVLLAPGTNANGPSNNIVIQGAMSYENAFTVNGVTVQDNIRNTALNLYIEDAVQEFTTSTAAMSAEYGRFGGGRIDVLTKSGGNEFSGSFRTTFNNDDWIALTPYSGDHPAPGAAAPRLDKTVPTYEATLGGPILKDKLWFFGAGRMVKPSTAVTTGYTLLPLAQENNEKRYEGKLTYSITPKHTVKGAYSQIDMTNHNYAYPNAASVMDMASVIDRKLPQQLFSANYTGVLTSNFFIEGQYSRRKFTFQDSGSMYTDLIKGTLMLDRQRANARYNSPTFCGVCDPEKRDNWNALFKANYFLSTKSGGTHQFVAGIDAFNDQRFSNNHQSGSDYRVYTTTTIIGADGTVYPVINNDTTSFIRWTPIYVLSQGNNFKTFSGFLNDVWRLNNHLTFNLGLRYDKNDGADSMGNAVVKDAAFSPRVAVNFDPMGDGKWSLRAGYARYVTAIANSVGDAGSAGGQPATIDFDYLGPAINTVAGAPLVTSAQALQTLFDWFNANGGTNRPIRGTPSIPGLTTKIADTLASPHNDELTLGVGRKIGTKASLRLDGVYRKFKDFYTTQVDMSTGKVTNSIGKVFDLAYTVNSNLVERNYKGLIVQADYRVNDRLSIAGNYTLSDTKGNVPGENATSGPTTSGILYYPEYFQTSWTAPLGYLGVDQRHKVNLWGSWELPLPTNIGVFNLGLLERVNTGTPYGAAGTVNTIPYVTNPGYTAPPASETYFFTGRDAFRMGTEKATDLALNWSKKLGMKNAQLFFRGTVVNLFNQDAITNSVYIDTTTNTRNNVSSLQAFNPFTTQPVQGVNWSYGTNFGKPTSRLAYQTPRTYQFSVGFRF